MAIAFTNLGATNAGANPFINPDVATGSDLTTLANSSWTPPTSGLIMLASWSGQSGAPNTPTCSGNNITWTQIAVIQQGTTYKHTLFAADASGSTTGATTLAFAGQTQTAKIGFILCYATGVDLTGGVAAAFVQAATAQGFGTTASVSMSAASNADNRPLVFYGAAQPSTQFSETASWTEMDDGTNNWLRLGSEYRTDQFDTAPSVTWTTSSNWAIIATELKAAGTVSAIKSLVVNVTPQRW